MTENVVKVNRLPAMTWNWLKMNDDLFDTAGLSVAGGIDAVLPDSLKGADIDTAELQALAAVETGMGPEFAGAVSGLKAADDTAADREGIADGSSESADCVIVADSGVKEEQPVRMKHSSYVENGVNSSFIVAREDSEVCVIADMTDIPDSAEGAGTVTKVLVKDRARVKIVEVFKAGENSRVFTDIGAVLGEDAQLEVVQIFLGGRKVNAGCQVALQGDRAGFTEYTAYDAPAGSKYDFNYVARHFGKDTTADMHASGVMHEKAEKTMRQTIDFLRGCAGSKGAEREEVLLLDDDLVNKTVPLILCKEEDVEGEHGASIGKLSEEVLFYLRTRGLTDEEIYRLMASGRLMSVVSKIGDEETEKKMSGLILGESEEDDQSAIDAE